MKVYPAKVKKHGGSLSIIIPPRVRWMLDPPIQEGDLVEFYIEDGKLKMNSDSVSPMLKP